MTIRSGLLAAILAALLSGAGLAQPAASPPPPAAPEQGGSPARRTSPDRPGAERPTTQSVPSLPPDAVTRHSVELADRTIRFVATAGGIELADRRATSRTDIAYIDYRILEANRASRPVTFVVNGGPGASSAWLQLGALGPWRIAMVDAAAAPSAPAPLLPNAETWLDFTDLVFIDPVGTGYSGFLQGDGEARRRIWSVEGDDQSLAEFIRRWVEKNGRAASPKYLVGESYGGFRGPRLARVLQREHGIAVSGLVLVSPVLDFGGRSAIFDPLALAARLPTIAAIGRASSGLVSRTELEEVERYATSEYLIDLVRGVRDPETIARMSRRVAALTGLDPAWVQRHQARLGIGETLRQLGAPTGSVVSAYDGTVTGPDPFPSSPRQAVPDPVLDALIAPLSRAMLGLYDEKLNWRPEERRYEVLNRATSREWDWGRGNNVPEAVSSLRLALAQDGRLRVVIAHGLYDLVTPYFASQLILDQIPSRVGGDRVRLAAYPGGHMFYGIDGSRSALRDAGRAMIEMVN
ncbi:peptidase S10 [Roseomonas hellenica]|uniref:Peptidase S10 n=1 Tax=Plastoroseomonas hellenica TaxID=2687306 RepID=A0ABS5F7U4_9PROT|nr:peptidase S10 [Plastoroseomonas hellenica]MBR0668643.1 peptidase S10 [Plastoroseomonas hellenica]